MKTVLNVIWLILCGLWMCLFYLFAGVILCITIIGIPFGLASFRIGLFALWPFGRKAVERADAGAPSLIGNFGMRSSSSGFFMQPSRSVHVVV